MYCSGCGNALPQGLRYCNRCGARVVDVTDDGKPVVKTDKVVDHLATVICFVAIFGFGAAFLIVKSLLSAGTNTSAIATILLFILATIFGLSWLLIRQISESLKYSRQQLPEREPAPIHVRNTQPQQLEAAPEMISVTENTTRNFNPVYKERES